MLAIPYQEKNETPLPKAKETLLNEQATLLQTQMKKYIANMNTICNEKTNPTKLSNVCKHIQNKMSRYRNIIKLARTKITKKQRITHHFSQTKKPETTITKPQTSRQKPNMQNQDTPKQTEITTYFTKADKPP